MSTIPLSAYTPPEHIDQFNVVYLIQYSDGESVRQIMVSTQPYHDPAMASQIDDGTCWPVVPRDADLSCEGSTTNAMLRQDTEVHAAPLEVMNGGYFSGLFDHWNDAGFQFAGFVTECRRGHSGTPWADLEPCWKMRNKRRFFSGRTRLAMTFESRLAALRKAVRTLLHDEDTPNPRLINQAVPLCYGWVFQFGLQEWDPNGPIYYGASNIQRWEQVAEGGNPNVAWIDLGNAVQLLQSATLRITGTFSGPPPDVDPSELDLMDPEGDYVNTTWTDDVPDGHTVDLQNDAVFEEDTGGDGALVRALGGGFQDTDWLTPGDADNGLFQSFANPWQASSGTLLSAVQADDGEYVEVSVDQQFTNSLELFVGLFDPQVPDNSVIAGIEIEIIAEVTTGEVDLGHWLEGTGIRLAPGAAGSGWATTGETIRVDGAKTTYTLGDSGRRFGKTWTLEDINGALARSVGSDGFSVVLMAVLGAGGSATVRVHRVRVKVHYTQALPRAIVERTADLMTVGERYRLIVTHQEADESITLDVRNRDEAGEITVPPSETDPYSTYDIDLRGVGETELVFRAQSARLKMTWTRGPSASGKQKISRVRLLPVLAGVDDYVGLMKYNCTLVGLDPDDSLKLDELQAHADLCDDPPLGDLVQRDETGRDMQLALCSSLAGHLWDRFDGRTSSRLMLPPALPDGEYFTADDSVILADIESEEIDPEVTDTAVAGKTQTPIHPDRTASVTDTFTPQQRANVTEPWRIHRRVKWDEIDTNRWPYVAPLTVTGIDPATGAEAGGTSVTITGTGFSAIDFGGADSATIGGSALVNPTVVDDTTITGDTPAGTGTGDVVVTRGAESATLVGGFEYVAADPNFSDVTLLLNFGGSDGATTFVDDSNTPHTITANGDAQIDTSLGYNTGLFDGNGDYLSAPYVQADFDWWPSDYTVEAWIYVVTMSAWSYLNVTQRPTLIGCANPATGVNYWSFGPRSDGRLVFYYFNGSPIPVVATGSISTGSLVHVAMSKNSSGIHLAVNGTVESPVAVSGTPQSSANSPVVLTIGQINSRSIDGHVQGLRITKGVARYTSNFTPPAAPFPDS